MLLGLYSSQFHTKWMTLQHQNEQFLIAKIRFFRRHSSKSVFLCLSEVPSKNVTTVLNGKHLNYMVQLKDKKKNKQPLALSWFLKLENMRINGLSQLINDRWYIRRFAEIWLRTSFRVAIFDVWPLSTVFTFLLVECNLQFSIKYVSLKSTVFLKSVFWLTNSYSCCFNKERLLDFRNHLKVNKHITLKCEWSFCGC